MQNQRITSRHVDCQASLDIKIKKRTRGTLRNDTIFLKKYEMQGVITIQKNHSHPVECAEALKLLRPTTDVREQFMDMFQDGLSPSEARQLHHGKLLLLDNAFTVLANGSLNPPERSVRMWHQQWREKNFGKLIDSLETIRGKINSYKEKGVDIFVTEPDQSPWAIVVVTGIMQRAQKLPSSSEIIFVDTTASVDATSSNLTVVLTATKAAGSCPLAILIHESQSMAGYGAGFSLLIKHYPTCFGGKNAPTIFMTDGSDAEKGALAAIFRTAIQLLCHFHKAQAEWRWLHSAQNKIPIDYRPIYMKCFQDLMYSTTEDGLAESEEKFFKTVEHDNYKERVSKELEDDKIKEWVLLYRVGLIESRGHNTNNFAEITMRVLKDIVLHRMKAFNPTALVEFIVIVLEEYLQKRLLDFAYVRRAAPRLLYTKLLQRMPPGSADKILVEGCNTFKVPSASQDSVYYKVRADLGFCNCPSGIQGRICKHQVLVQEKFGILFPNAPSISSKDRYALGKLALGSQCPPQAFFLGLGDQLPPSSPIQAENQECNNADITDASDINNNDGNLISVDGVQTGSELSGNSELQHMRKEISQEFTRLCDMALTDESFSNSSGPVLLQKLKSVRTPENARAAFVRIKAAVSGVLRKRAGIIHVQPDSIRRRKSSNTRGSKRLPAGRPFKSEPCSKQMKKKHKLSLSIKKNCR